MVKPHPRQARSFRKLMYQSFYLKEFTLEKKLGKRINTIVIDYYLLLFIVEFLIVT